MSKKILIVDDEPNLAAILAASLEKLGHEYEFDTAGSGSDALAKLQETQYTLLITDYSMPGMSGLDLVEAVRQLSPGTQVILMTAHPSEQLKENIDQLNLDGYLSTSN